MKKLLNKIPTQILFAIMAGFAIAAVICFIQIDSASADKHSSNWKWILRGAGSLVVSALLFIRVIKNTNS